MDWRRVALVLTLVAGPSAAEAHDGFFEVTVTNLTRAQSFTPILAVSHDSESRLVTVGEPASEGLALLAEGGATGTLEAEIRADGDVRDAVTSDGLLGPGESVTLRIEAGGRHDHVSVAAMLIPTNDTFMAAAGVRIPAGRRARSVTVWVPAYDAGTEENDQRCASMPGPRCGGEGVSAEPGDGDEGFVHVSRGFHDLGTADADGGEILGPATYDWRNPVAKVTIRRTR